MKLLTNIILLLFLLQTTSGKAQNNTMIDQYLLNVYKDHVVPGFAVTVVQKGKVIFSKGYGLESLGSTKPFTPQTVSAIGSLTKSITSMAIIQLVEQKKVELDKPVTHYLKWFRTANKDRSDKITVRMLLNNTSGLYSNSSSQSDEATENSLENMVKSLSSTFLTREPGFSYQYSNVGFSVAGLIISKVSGVAYQQYVQNNIFRPLNMLHTSTELKDFAKLKSIEGHYYGINRAILAKKEKNVKQDGYIPAGSLMRSSTEDLGRYLISLMGTGKNEVISKRSRDEIWRKNISFPGLTKDDGGGGTTFGYGLGWMTSTIEGRHIIHHGGSTGKMSSFTMIDLKNETAATILMNVDLSFINKYEYPTEINIINNIMRLASGLPISRYGLPTVKDPTLNKYTLNDTLGNHYVGNYQLKSENVIFLYAGTEMKIAKTSDNKLQCTIYRGEQIINQFTLDFINEGLAVSRNIGSPLQIRFKLKPNGKVSGLFFTDMEFIREDQLAASFYKTVVSPDHKLSFKLPRNWKIGFQKNEFSAQSQDGHIQLKGSFNNESNSGSLQLLMGSFSIRKSGLSHSENVGKYQWKEKSYLCKINKVEKQVISLQSQIEDKNICILLISREGYLTTNTQVLMNSFLNSIKVL